MSIERELQKNYQEVFYPPQDIQVAAGPTETTTDVNQPAFNMPGMGKRSQKSEIGQNLPVLAADVAAGAGKGLISGIAGFAGDIEALYQGVKGIVNRGGDESALKGFIKGMAEQTIAPTSDDVSKWLDANVGPVVPKDSGMSPEMQSARETAANVGEFAGQMVADPTVAVKAAKFTTGALKGFKSVKAKDIPELFSHGTTEKAATSIMESGGFNPSGSERQYSYSQFGIKASYLTPKEGWWLNPERAASGRAAIYESAVDVKIDPKAKIVRIDSIQELNQLAKKSGFADAYDMMSDLNVDSIEYAKQAEKAANSSLEEFTSFMKNEFPDFSYSDMKGHYEDMKKLDGYFNNANAATKKLMDSGVDGIYISEKFNDSFSPEEYKNWFPASDQLAMFKQEMLKPVAKRSLKGSTDEKSTATMTQSQQEPK